MMVRKSENSFWGIKMSDNKSSSGIGFTGLLTIVFITLKLLKVIDWSWWWVLSPIWITTIIVITVISIIALIALIFK